MWGKARARDPAFYLQREVVVDELNKDHEMDAKHSKQGKAEIKQDVFEREAHLREHKNHQTEEMSHPNEIPFDIKVEKKAKEKKKTKKKKRLRSLNPHQPKKRKAKPRRQLVTRRLRYLNQQKRRK